MFVDEDSRSKQIISNFFPDFEVECDNMKRFSLIEAYTQSAMNGKPNDKMRMSAFSIIW